MGSKQDFEWVDTDGDGIPDIFDKEPLIPARNDFERHLQDKRQDWHGPLFIKEKGKHTIEKCAHCEKNVIDEHLIVYQDFPLCINCWNAVKHVIFKEKYDRILENETAFFTAYRDIRTKFMQRMENADKKWGKISGKILKSTLSNFIVCEKEDFKLFYADAIEAILSNLLNMKPDLIFSLYFPPKTINITHYEERKRSFFLKDYARLFNLNGISISKSVPNENEDVILTKLKIESAYGNLILEIKYIHTSNEIKIENKYTGKACNEFIDAWNVALMEIFKIETKKIAHHIELGELYLSCAEVKEAQDLFYQVCIRLKENQSENLKKVYTNALAKMTNIYTNIPLVACPICFQTYTNSIDVENHIAKSHQKKIGFRIIQ